MGFGRCGIVLTCRACVVLQDGVVNQWNGDHYVDLMEAVYTRMDMGISAMYAPSIRLLDLGDPDPDEVVTVWDREPKRQPTLFRGVGGKPMDREGASQCLACATQSLSTTDEGYGGLRVELPCRGQGVNVTVMIGSMLGTVNGTHVEDNLLMAANMLATGRHKVWYGVYGDKYRAFRDVFRAKHRWMGTNLVAKAVWPVISPAEAQNWGIQRFVQRPGDLVITLPGLFAHWTFSSGRSAAESVNFHLPFGEVRTVADGCRLFKKELEELDALGLMADTLEVAEQDAKAWADAKEREDAAIGRLQGGAAGVGTDVLPLGGGCGEEGRE